MQAQAKPKKSLFSQRIKEARLHEEHDHKPTPSQSSFPKALSINLSSTQQPSKQQQLKMKNQTPETERKRFADRILGSALKEEEVRKIQSENQESIRNMSKEEVLKYQDMLVKQMPAEFLNKFKKGINKVHQKQDDFQDRPKQEEMEDEREEQGKEMKEEKMSDSESEGREEEESLRTLQMILLNIQTHEVGYNHTNQATMMGSRMITMRDLKQMVQSQNNQTQIIGSKLMGKLCQTLFQSPQSKAAIPIFYLSDQYFHMVVLACDAYNSLIRSLMHQIEKTKFKSCWVEMIDALSNCITAMCGWMKRSKEGVKMVESVGEFIKSQLAKKMNFLHTDTNESSKTPEILMKKLHQTVSSINGPQFTYLQASFDELGLYPKEVVDLIIIEELETLVHKPTYRYHTILQNIASFSNTLPDRETRQHFIASVVYPIAQELVLRQYRSNKMDKQVMAVKEIVYQWLTQQMGPTLINVRSVKHNLCENEEANLFRCLHITKILAPNDYAALLTNKSMQQQDDLPISVMTNHEVLANLLTLLNIDEYFNPTASISNPSERSSEIENVQQMLSFLAARLAEPKINYLKHISACLFVDLMAIFLNYLQSAQKSNQNKTGECALGLTYHDINDDILNNAFAALANAVIQTGQEKKLWNMMSAERMKSLIQSYNYNSFGHYCFTKMLAFLAATSPPNIQALIIDEVIARYPFLFCYAAERGLYGPPSLYLQGQVTSQMTNVYEMVCFNQKFDHNNLFIRYLTKK